jgi:hypothetical protein
MKRALRGNYVLRRRLSAYKRPTHFLMALAIHKKLLQI